MAYHSTSTENLLNQESDEVDSWSKDIFEDDNFGPGPPPPEFLLPPPPLPDFMLEGLDGECVKRSLPEHFSNCDMSFASIKSTSSGHLPGLFGDADGGQPGTSHIHLISVALGVIALFFLALCVAIFLAWRKCRSRNRLAYLRKTSSNFETTVETSEHPLIYDDSNLSFMAGPGIRTHPRLPVAHVNSYQLENSHRHLQNGTLVQSSSYPFDSSTGTRSICRPDRLHFNENNDNDSRIYEELFLAEDHVYSDAHQGALPHLSDHYYQPAAVVRPTTSVSRSSTLNSIKRILGFGQTDQEPPVGSPLPPFLHYVPAPPQFMSPGALSSDSLMLMSPDYSAVYHPIGIPQPDGLRASHPLQHRDTLSTDNCPNNNSHNDVLTSQLRNATKCSNNMAESSFSSSSCSSGSTRPPSHNNSTTSTLPVACLSSSSCSCSSSTCQYQRSTSSNQQRPIEEHQNVYAYMEQPVRNHDNQDNHFVVNHPRMNMSHHDQLSYAVQVGGGGAIWPQTSRRPVENGNKNEGFGIFSSLWRKHRSKTSGRSERRTKRLPTSSTTIFRLEPTHPSYPRLVTAGYQVATPANMGPKSVSDGNGNPHPPFANAALPPIPLSLGVHHPPTTGNQRFAFAPGNHPRLTPLHRQSDLRPYKGVNHLGTPTMNRTGNHARQTKPDHTTSHFHGTLSNRRRRTRRKDGGEPGDSGEEEDLNARLPLLPGDELYRSPLSVGTLGKQGRVSACSGVMPNPDDILPKRAWTDFSGTDEWPNFTSHETDRSNSNENIEKFVLPQSEVTSDQEMYANCEPPKSVPIPKERRFVPRVVMQEPDSNGLAHLKPELDLNGLDESLVDGDDFETPDTDDDPLESVPRHFDCNEETVRDGGKEASDVSCDERDSSPTTTFPPKTYRSTKFISLANTGSPTKKSIGSPPLPSNDPVVR